MEADTGGWIDEQEEAKWSAYELPVQLPNNEDVVNALHIAVACRTIIAAAKGGQLRHLFAGFFHDFDYPFAVRSLLPYWVPMESWLRVSETPDGWLKSASTFRPLLAHASLWLDVAEGSELTRSDRELTRQEVQSLNAHFSDDKMPEVAPLGGNWETQPVERYLPWLEEDAELAQRVADAWNAVVRSGKADETVCSCSRCIVHWHEEDVRLGLALAGLEEFSGDEESDRGTESEV